MNPLWIDYHARTLRRARLDMLRRVAWSVVATAAIMGAVYLTIRGLK